MGSSTVLVLAVCLLAVGQAVRIGSTEGGRLVLREVERPECPDPLKVVRFNGVGGSVSVAGTGHAISPQVFTIEAWIRPQKAAYLDGLLGNLFVQGAKSYGWGFYFDDGQKLVFRAGADGLNDEAFSINVNLDEWVHIAVTVTPGTAEFFRGEQSMARAKVKSSIDYSKATDFTFGEFKDVEGSSHSFGGFISEVRLWNHVRTSGDIKDNLNKPLSGKEFGLLEYWPMSEGEGERVFSNVMGGHEGKRTTDGTEWIDNPWPCEDCTLDCFNGGTLDPIPCRCLCVRPWRGVDCRECPLNCMNGGTLDKQRCLCQCPEGFSGDTCSGPRVDMIYPNHGAAEGGYVATIEGAGFASPGGDFPKVEIGGHPCNDVTVDPQDSDTKLSCNVPKGAGNDQSVNVILGAQRSPKNDLFTYDKPRVNPANSGSGSNGGDSGGDGSGNGSGEGDGGSGSNGSTGSSGSDGNGDGNTGGSGDIGGGCGLCHGPNDGPKWSYSGTEGPSPDSWSKTPQYQLCSLGKHQSPIDFGSAKPVELATVPKIQLDLKPTSWAIKKVEHTMVVSFDHGGGIALNGVAYELKTATIHIPGEHRVNGKQAPAEIHLIFSSSATAEMAVIAVPVKIVEGITTETDNSGAAFFEGFVKNLPMDCDVHTSSKLGAEALTAKAFMPPMANNQLPTYIFYDGSVSEPPCTEGAFYIYLTADVTITRYAYQVLFARMDKARNDRPVQQMLHRSIQALPGSLGAVTSAISRFDGSWKKDGGEALAPAVMTTLLQVSEGDDDLDDIKSLLQSGKDLDKEIAAGPAGDAVKNIPSGHDGTQDATLQSVDTSEGGDAKTRVGDDDLEDIASMLKDGKNLDKDIQRDLAAADEPTGTDHLRKTEEKGADRVADNLSQKKVAVRDEDSDDEGQGAPEKAAGDSSASAALSQEDGNVLNESVDSIIATSPYDIPVKDAGIVAGQSCNESADCGVGFQCVKNLCARVVAGMPCGEDFECPNDLACVQNICGGPKYVESPVLSQGDVASNNTVNVHVQTLKGIVYGANVTCVDDAMCISGHCVNGTCAKLVPCPNNCSGKGICDVDGKCQCMKGYVGESCETKQDAKEIQHAHGLDKEGECFMDCMGHGRCNPSSRRCFCQFGYAGKSCQLTIPAYQMVRSADFIPGKFENFMKTVGGSLDKEPLCDSEGCSVIAVQSFYWQRLDDTPAPAPRAPSAPTPPQQVHQQQQPQVPWAKKNTRPNDWDSPDIVGKGTPSPRPEEIDGFVNNTIPALEDTPPQSTAEPVAPGERYGAVQGAKDSSPSPVKPEKVSGTSSEVVAAPPSGPNAIADTPALVPGARYGAPQTAPAPPPHIDEISGAQGEVISPIPTGADAVANKDVTPPGSQYGRVLTGVSPAHTEPHVSGVEGPVVSPIPEGHGVAADTPALVPGARYGAPQTAPAPPPHIDEISGAQGEVISPIPTGADAVANKDVTPPGSQYGKLQPVGVVPRPPIPSLDAMIEEMESPSPVPATQPVSQESDDDRARDLSKMIQNLKAHESALISDRQVAIHDAQSSSEASTAGAISQSTKSPSSKGSVDVGLDERDPSSSSSMSDESDRLSKLVSRLKEESQRLRNARVKPPALEFIEKDETDANRNNVKSAIHKSVREQRKNFRPADCDQQCFGAVQEFVGGLGREPVSMELEETQGLVDKEYGLPPAGLSFEPIQPGTLIPTYPWSYGTNGEEEGDWGPYCKGGSHQSPINVPTCRHHDVVDGKITGALGVQHFDPNGVRTDYHDGWRFNTANTGYGLQIVEDATAPNHKVQSIEVFGEIYNLRAVVFHHPAEHTINGDRPDFEMQLVHTPHPNSNSTGEVWLSVMMDLGAAKDDVGISRFISIPGIFPLTPGQWVGSEMSLDPTMLLPRGDPFDYYMYDGSTTTPPCQENVRWIVFPDRIQLSSKQASRLKHLFPLKNNARPIKDMNGRFLLTPETHLKSNANYYEGGE